MGLSIKNTNKVLKRFKDTFDNEHYNGKITIHDKSKYGCEAIEVVIDEKSITLRELQDLKEDIHNTMSVGIDEETGKFYISIW